MSNPTDERRAEDDVPPSLSALYRDGAREQPPLALDDRLLAAARAPAPSPRAARRERTRGDRPTGGWWYGFAATALASVLVVVVLMPQGFRPESSLGTTPMVADEEALPGDLTMMDEIREEAASPAMAARNQADVPAPAPAASPPPAASERLVYSGRESAMQALEFSRQPAPAEAPALAKMSRESLGTTQARQSAELESALADAQSRRRVRGLAKTMREAARADTIAPVDLPFADDTAESDAAGESFSTDLAPAQTQPRDVVASLYGDRLVQLVARFEANSAIEGTVSVRITDERIVIGPLGTGTSHPCTRPLTIDLSTTTAAVEVRTLPGNAGVADAILLDADGERTIVRCTASGWTVVPPP